MTEVSIGAIAFGGLTDASGVVYDSTVSITKNLYSYTTSVYSAPYMTIAP